MYQKTKEGSFIASEKTLLTVLAELGLEPLDDRAIIVKFAPENLSAKIARFFSMEFYVLQLCKDKLVLLPFSQLTLALKREVALEIPYSEIQSVSVNEDGLNYLVTITTLDDTIRLTAQQKELMVFRTSAMLSWDGIKFIYGSDDTWHGRNLDATLADLAKLAG